jgi:tetratricopeptide (TPR) repeat protein
MRCIGGLGLAAFLVVAAAAGAEAQGADESSDAEARALFNAGQVAYADARFEAALDYFQRAYELSGRAGLLFNVASAAERVRKDELALQAYRKYLEALPNADNRRFVEGRVRFLEDAVASARRSEADRAEKGRVPTPEEAARAAPAEEERFDAGAESREPREGGSVFGKWWFWTTVAAVVAAGVVVGVLMASRGAGGTQDPLPGDVGPGGVVVTLGSGR